ncbi:MAG: peptidoglycan DD-metalloendopeptidase family protein [Actinotalea sp.]|nr:peptidoglycan DD-metalloendopeptidase family protein [Actinotalea sp.]
MPTPTTPPRPTGPARAPGAGARTTLRRVVVALLGLGLLAGSTLPATADDLDRLEDQRRTTEQQQRANQGELEGVHADLEDTDAELLQAQRELEDIQARIPGAEAELAAAEALLAQLQLEAQLIAERLTVAEEQETTITGQIEADAGRAEDIRVAIGQMARDAYKGDMAASALSAVLDARTTDEFVQQSELAATALRAQTQALRDLEQINGVNRNRQARLTAVREQIVELKAEADAKVLEAEAARAQAEARKVELERLQQQETERIAVIESKRAEQLARRAELEQQREQLQTELKEIIAAQEAERQRILEEQRKREEAERRAREEAQRKAQQEAERRAREEAASRRSSGGSSGGSAAPAPAPAPAPPPASTPSRPFTNPTSIEPIYKTSDYGNRLHPVLGYWRLHAGVDLRTWCGTPIYAAMSGEVVWARYRGGFGNQVMVNHGYWNSSSLMSSYNHLSSFSVRAGQTVSRGQLLGYSGNTGTSSACHLHFEAYVNGGTVDPWPMISR